MDPVLTIADGFGDGEVREVGFVVALKLAVGRGCLLDRGLQHAADARDDLPAQQGVRLHQGEPQTLAKERFVFHVALDQLLALLRIGALLCRCSNRLLSSRCLDVDTAMVGASGVRVIKQWPANTRAPSRVK